VTEPSGSTPARTHYASELRDLALTYDLVRSSDHDEILGLIDSVAERDVVFVGSGGALAVAELGAHLHQRYTGCVALALTPAQFAQVQLSRPTAVVIVSASARHPDAAVTARLATSGGYRPVALLTQRALSELRPDLQLSGLRIVTVPHKAKKDGFLATNSTLAMATALACGYLAGTETRLPEKLPFLSNPPKNVIREHCLLLSDPQHLPVAADLEARLHETGLASVQVTDFRNLAHGRHVGLARNIESTTVVTLESSAGNQMAEATVRILPESVQLLRLRTPERWPASALDLLVGSMHLVSNLAETVSLDPARPGVTDFGRRLYHLSYSRMLPEVIHGPIERKLQAVGPGKGSEHLRHFYTEALRRWLDEMTAAPFGAIVLDYDGTCCTTEDRFDLPDEGVRRDLSDLLSAGAIIGFASGRGTSLHRDLRKWVPQEFWGNVELGLYNGGMLLSMSDELPGAVSSSGDLADAASRLKSGPFGAVLKLEEREHQITVQPMSPLGIGVRGLAEIVNEVLAWPPRLRLKSSASAHSVDVIPADSSKVDVIERIRNNHRIHRVLAIGDQGQVGGNDFELLASVPSSLSVDRCSADPTRCWNLVSAPTFGPASLTNYFASLKARGPGEIHWEL
jgi:hypothetical protein